MPLPKKTKWGRSKPMQTGLVSDEEARAIADALSTMIESMRN